MTDQEKQELSERAEIEGRILADVVIPRLRGEIWKASATTSIIAGLLVFSWYRSDFAALKSELRGTPAKQATAAGPTFSQENSQRVLNVIQPAKVVGLLEATTERILNGEFETESPDNGNLRRTDGATVDVVSGNIGR